MRVRPSGESRPARGDNAAQAGEIRAMARALERGLGEGPRGGDKDGGAFIGNCRQQGGGAAGREDHGGALQQRCEPGPGSSVGNQQPVVWPEVGMQQKVGQRADQLGRQPEAGERRGDIGG